jgi:hypothetical protein
MVASLPRLNLRCGASLRSTKLLVSVACGSPAPPCICYSLQRLATLTLATCHLIVQFRLCGELVVSVARGSPAPPWLLACEGSACRFVWLWQRAGSLKVRGADLVACNREGYSDEIVSFGGAWQLLACEGSICSLIVNLQLKVRCGADPVASLRRRFRRNC